MLDSVLGNIRHIDMPRPPDRDETGGAPTVSSLPLWPEDAAIELFHQQPTMGAIRFSDTAIYIEQLRAEIETQALNRERTEPIAGGAFKLHDVDQWTSPAASLVTARAHKLVTSMLNSERLSLQTAMAIVVPRGRALPARGIDGARASAVSLLAGGGLYLQHERIDGLVVQAPHEAPGLMLAHPSTMRPCVRENIALRPVVIVVWDYGLE